MRVIRPLDRNDLLNIPSSIEGKLWIGGPYESPELLQEPSAYGDEQVDWRSVAIANAAGEVMCSAHIDVAGGRHRLSEGVWRGNAVVVTQKLRYLYRRAPTRDIQGAVTVEVMHEINGAIEQFSASSTMIIQSVFVRPESRGKSIARVLLAEVLRDAPNAKVHPQFSKDGLRLFGFEQNGRRTPNQDLTDTMAR